MLSLCSRVSPFTNYRIVEPVFMKLGIYIYIYIMTPEPTSAADLKPPVSLCLYVHLPAFARERLGRNVNAATNSHGATEDF
jgi:hypothetical protein